MGAQPRVESEFVFDEMMVMWVGVGVACLASERLQGLKKRGGFDGIIVPRCSQHSYPRVALWRVTAELRVSKFCPITRGVSGLCPSRADNSDQAVRL